MKRRKVGQETATPEQRARRVLQELHGLVRAAAEARGFSGGEMLPVDFLVLPVGLRVDGPFDDADVRRLAAEVGRRVDEAVRSLSVFRPGRVYCFQCDRPDCGHDRPPGPDSTFVGYTPTGKPEWVGFANLLIERGDPRVERLYVEPPEVVSVVHAASELRRDLLPSFGRESRVYEVLGQVVAGLVPSDLVPRRQMPPGRVALTFQVVQVRAAGESRRLRLNLLGLTPDEITERAASAGARGPAEWLRRSVVDARRRLDALGRRVHALERRGDRVDIEKEVGPLLARLSADIERVFRPETRRTLHAQERHRDGDRPTATALRDADEAAPERFLRDAERDTLVVLGPRGRTHIFTLDGRHVTSMQLGPGELDRKFGRARWRSLNRDEVLGFKGRLKARGA